MEFTGGKVQIRRIAVTLAAAYFAGRVNLFDGTFPAAVAFISVMIAASTVSIYVLPALLAGMLSYLHQGVLVYGDVIAAIGTGIFFLFFHQKPFSMVQRTVITVTITILSHCLYYSASGMIFLLKPERLLQEAVALMIYIRVFNLIAKLAFVGPSAMRIPKENIQMALAAAAVSFVGAVGAAEAVFPIWVFLSGAVLLHYGITSAFAFAAFGGVFWFCQGESGLTIIPIWFAMLLVGWYGGMFAGWRNQKPIVAAALFFTVILGETSCGTVMICTMAVAMMILASLPQQVMTKGFCLMEARFMPEAPAEKDLQYLAIKANLQKKRDIFLQLGQLYSKSFRDKEIISYQFAGMARTVDGLLQELRQGSRKDGRPENLMKISVGQASYAFEDVSGDSMAAFSFREDDVALILSDGMGKGSQAAEESTLVVETISKLLQAGFDVDLAMKTINGILMWGNRDEGFATVDLAVIDRKKGWVKLYKMGAATTFIKHEGGVSMLKRQALPAGVTGGLKLEYLDARMKPGDVLVMVSDGVTDCDRKDPGCQWLQQRLMEIQSKDPETIADLLVNKAAEKYGIRERDDLSVIAAVVG